MKFSPSTLIVAGLTGSAVAFPGVPEALARNTGNPALQKRQGLPDLNTRFNAAEQYVDISGEHEWRAPNLAGGDQRGPCPGLNAMANHGYIPRNGVGSHLDFITGTHTVFGMGADLAGFLTVLGGVLDGDGLGWSIGGPAPSLASTLGGLLGQPQGISGSHNKYETDVSPGRGDLYKYGDDFSLQMSQYQQLYDMAIQNGDKIDLDLLTTFRSLRYDDSVETNPYLFLGPFSGVFVSPAAFTFIFRFMGNKSAEHPTGYLNTATMNSFFGVTKAADGSLSHNPGMERIPANFYRRANLDEYSIPFFNADLVLAATRFPKFLATGGNLGKTNSFVGVDVGNLTGGVYQSHTLLEGNNLSCFASQVVTQVTPDLIRCGGVISDVLSATKKLTDQITTSFGDLACPQITALETNQFKQFPGYGELNCATGAY